MFPLYDDNPHSRTPWVTYLIVLVNVIVQVMVWQLPDTKQFELFCHYGFVPARIQQLSNPQLVLNVEIPLADEVPIGQPVPKLKVVLEPDSGEIYLSMLTMMFLHGGWMHLIGNMWFLWIFGNNIEDRLGHISYLVFYLFGGAVALACQYLMDPESLIPTVGASGAIAAVLGAYAITFPHAKVRTVIMLVVIITVVDLPALVVLGFFFVRDIFSAFAERQAVEHSGVAFWAHIGGFVAGMILMPILGMGAAPPGANWKDEADEQFRFETPNRHS
jgi:membrane associated rhomboid family serine protease